MGADPGTIGRIARDISGKAEASPQRTPSIGRRMPRADPRTRNGSGNPDMMASAFVDTSGNTDTTAADTTDDVGLHAHVLDVYGLLCVRRVRG
jgi:hypothetical protein